MRILLLHPEDSATLGVWSRQRWDLIVDLGRSSPFSADEWSRQCCCAVLRIDSFRQGATDLRQVREIVSVGRGRIVDEEGIDWWDLMSLLIAPEIVMVLAISRMAAEISPSAEIWATRSGEPVSLVAAFLERTVQTFEDKSATRLVGRALRYASLARRFSAAQIKEIFFDKYDPGYRWRSRLVSQPKSCVEPVVLVPSAYGNVSRMAAGYARLLPQQSFLMVTTRQSGRQFSPPANVHLRELAAYARTGSSVAEAGQLLGHWTELSADLRSSPELKALSRAGVTDSIPERIREGLSVRNAWREVLEREPVCGVLCGDDSNRYTLLPVLLAARRKIPTVDFHHGAFDGRYLLKDLPCDVYLVKNDMERDYLLRVCGLPADKIVVGAPPSASVPSARKGEHSQTSSAIFFSEPYEVVGMRVQEVYRELLPALCRLARANGRGVIVKLHPFESYAQRSRMVQDILSPEDGKLVTVVDGPLTDELLSQAWFGITVESTTVIDCLQNGVCCFLCGWVTLSSYEYVQQYARFGVGEMLRDVEQIKEIPSRLADFHARRGIQSNFSTTVDPAMLRSWLTAERRESVNATPTV